MTETTRNGPSVTDCLEAAMRADPSLTIEEAIRTVPVSEPARQANLAFAEAREAVAAAETTHQCPPDGGGLMSCCGLTPFEVPRTDRITPDPALVTCGAKVTP